MNNETEAPDLKPCPFCKGGETRIEPCGQTWMGQQYSEPQYYRLTHNGKLPEGDGFETCHIQFRARTPHDIVYMWNDTRADLSDANDKRIEELGKDLTLSVSFAKAAAARIAELVALVDHLTHDPDFTTAYRKGFDDGKKELNEKLAKAEGLIQRISEAARVYEVEELKGTD